jgi:sugar lactone lactonase YvrE
VRTDGILETIAGTGVTGFGGDGGPATAALLNFPAAPVYDSAGNLYFADQANHRVRRIDSSGIIATVAGDGIPYAAGMDTSGPALERSLNPAGLAVGLSGKVYILDPTLNRLRLLTADGQLRDFFAFSTDGSNTNSLTSDGAGNLYTIQTTGFRYEAIARIAPDGTLSTFREWQAAPNSGLAFVGPITADAKGNVYGVQSGSIVRFSPDGGNTAIAGGGQGYASSPDGPALPSVISPSALAVNAQGNIAFADTFVFVNHYLALAEIRKITADSQLQTLAGNAPQIVPDGTPLSSAWFEQPSAIAFSRTGDLYLADFRACLIRRIGANGVLSTFAGTGNCAYPAPSGPNAKSSDIVQPYSLAVDSQNRVWVADYYLNLYSIAQDGTISPILSSAWILSTACWGMAASN